MYVAKLPGRQLLDPAMFDAGAQRRSKSHAVVVAAPATTSAAPPDGGHNLDLSIPGWRTCRRARTVKLVFKSRWDIEWDFDYGFVLTTTDGGKTYTSHASENGYTSSNTDPTAGNPNQARCQATYDNGHHRQQRLLPRRAAQAIDRKLGNYPDSVFLADSYDISDLAGEPNGALRFSYATDPGAGPARLVRRRREGDRDDAERRAGAAGHRLRDLAAVPTTRASSTAAAVTT